MSLTGLALGLIVGLIGMLIWGLGLVLRIFSPVLWPLAIAGILSYLLDPVVDFFERRNISRQKSIFLVFAICFLALVAVFANIVPRVVRESEKLVSDLPSYAQRLQQDFNDWVSRKPFFDAWRNRLFPLHPSATTNEVGLSPATNNNAVITTNSVTQGTQTPPGSGLSGVFSDNVLGWIKDAAPQLATWLKAQASRVASWAGMIVGMAMVPVFTFYFLLEKEKIRRGWTNYLPLQESRLKDELVFVLSAINNYLIVFFRGQVLIAFGNAIMLTIGFLAMGLNYAVFLGLLAGALSIVPYLGTIVTIIPTVLLAAVQFRDAFHPIMVVAIYGLVHLMEGFVISPKVMGDRVGLHPLTIIIAVLVGTTLLGGILGGILAIPLTAALRVLMFRYVWKTRSKQSEV